MPASSQNNQNSSQDNSNPRSGGAPKNISEEKFNIKVPPSGMLGSSQAPLNHNGALKQDKNIKVDLNLSGALPDSEANAGKLGDIAPVVAFPAKEEPLKKDFSPETDSKADARNSDYFKLSSGEVQGPRSPLVPNNSRKIIFSVVVVLALGALAAGGYYLSQKGDDIPVASVSPEPTIPPIIDSTLDSDSDTIPDAVEKAIRTNPDKKDTDGDSFNDLPEIKNGYSPIIAGAAGKYTPEQWQAIKDKIKAADAEFFEKEFGAVEVSPSPSPAADDSGNGSVVK